MAKTALQFLFSSAATTLLLFSLSRLAADTAAAPLKLEPKTTVTVNLNVQANFTCILPCTEDNHSIKWNVGDHNLKKVFLGAEHIFKIITGISVRIEEDSTCGMPEGGRVRQILRISTDSVDLNKTPVQCIAEHKGTGEITLLSYYSFLRVTDPSQSEANEPDSETTTASEPATVDCDETSQEADQTDQQSSSSEAVESALKCGTLIALDSGSSSLSPLLLLQLTLIGLIAQYMCSNM